MVCQIISYADITSPAPAQIPLRINDEHLHDYYLSSSSWSMFAAGGAVSVFVGRAAKRQPGFDFPTDLLVRGVVPSTQRFGTVTMLAQTQAEQPPPLFPGLWECNTLRTKSHFPFLSNFHTPAPLLLRLACPLKGELW